MLGDFLTTLTERTFNPVTEVVPRLPSPFEPAQQANLGEGHWQDSTRLQSDPNQEASAFIEEEGTAQFHHSSGARRASPPRLSHSDTSASQGEQFTLFEEPNRHPLGSVEARKNRVQTPFDKPDLSAEEAAPYAPMTAKTPAYPRAQNREPLPASTDNRADENSEGLHQKVSITPQALAKKPLEESKAEAASALQPALVARRLNSDAPASLYPAVPSAPQSPFANAPHSIERSSEGSKGASSLRPVVERAQPHAMQQQSTVTRQEKSQSALSQSEPVIHVSIGRIEVRATPAPAAPAKKTAAPSQVMSLDEYLSRRSGGGGR